MSKSIIINGAIITLAKTEIDCPNCKKVYNEDFYYKQLQKSDKGFIYKKCKECKEIIGISSNMMGDSVSWLKKDEILSHP